MNVSSGPRTCPSLRDAKARSRGIQSPLMPAGSGFAIMYVGLQDLIPMPLTMHLNGTTQDERFVAWEQTAHRTLRKS